MRAVAPAVATARLILQDIQASELQHAELDESAAARQRQQEQDQQLAAAAQREKERLEGAVAAAERRLGVLQQQAQVRGCLQQHCGVWDLTKKTAYGGLGQGPTILQADDANQTKQNTHGHSLLQPAMVPADS